MRRDVVERGRRDAADRLAERRGEEAAPLLEEARETFLSLGAEPWLERVERSRLSEAPGTVVTA